MLNSREHSSSLIPKLMVFAVLCSREASFISTIIISHISVKLEIQLQRLNT